MQRPAHCTISAARRHFDRPHAARNWLRAIPHCELCTCTAVRRASEHSGTETVCGVFGFFRGLSLGPGPWGIALWALAPARILGRCSCSCRCAGAGEAGRNVRVRALTAP